jgi:hypothetical protein
VIDLEREIRLRSCALGFLGDNSLLFDTTLGLCLGAMSFFLFGPDFRFDFSANTSFQIGSIASRGFSPFTFFLFRSEPRLFFRLSLGFLFRS